MNQWPSLCDKILKYSKIDAHGLIQSSLSELENDSDDNGKLI